MWTSGGGQSRRGDRRRSSYTDFTTGQSYLSPLTYTQPLTFRWICEALQAGRSSQGGGSAFLLDLHGHGHNHNYIELGYRVPATLLNQISSSSSDLDWSSILSTQSVAQEFTLSKLIQRRFGTSSEAVKEGLIGKRSFAGCLTNFIRKHNVLSKVTCIPSTEQPAPNNRGEHQHSRLIINYRCCEQVITPEDTRFSSMRGGEMWTASK